MTIERFTKLEFEMALPVSKATGQPMWEERGLEVNEYSYQIHVREGIVIKIRSSVKRNGIAASTGKDSIRCWLAREDGSPMGSKIQSYVTRVVGWQDRMDKVLRELWKRALMVEDCPGCGKPLSIFKVKKEGKNKGKLFVKCWDCKDHETFRFLDIPKPESYGKPKFEKMPEIDEEVVVKGLNDLPTKKAKVAMLKDLIAAEDAYCLWAMTRIYNEQTDYEKNCQSTQEFNKVGFTGVDAFILSSFSEQYKKRGSLSPKQMALANKKMPKYSKQLLGLLA